MRPAAASPYDQSGLSVKRLLFGSSLAAALLLSLGAVAGAETNIIDVHDIAGLTLMSSRAQVIITTWDRPQIRIDSSGPVNIEHQVHAIKIDGPAARPVTILAVKSANGRLELPQEQFVVQMPADGTPFDDTIVSGTGVLKILVPRNLTYLGVRLARGRVAIRGLRTTFIVKVGRGGVALDHMSGEGYVQVLEGPISANDSSFTRLRARTGANDVVMERCHAKQIDVSSINGTILYDDGTFEPGIAHFESVNGNVAIGLASGGAQIGGQTQGQIFTALDHGSNANVRPHEVNATIGGGGPYVSIASTSGTLYLYNGSLRKSGRRPNLPSAWAKLDKAIARFRARQFPGKSPKPIAPPIRF